MTAEMKNTQTALNLIMLAVFVWGTLLAIGVLVYRNSWLGASIVLGCTLAFLGIWKLLIWRAASRSHKKIATDTTDDTNL